MSIHNAPRLYTHSVCPQLRRLVRLRRQYDSRARVRKSHSLTKTRQVLYAVFNNVNRKVYVGLTRRTATERSTERFKEHLRTARQLDRQRRAGVRPDHNVNTPLYRDMVSVVVRNFGLFVLEKIPGRFPRDSVHRWAGANDQFVAVARPRELWWIFHLRSFRVRHTGKVSRRFEGGYNVETTRQRPRKRIAMMHRRHAPRGVVTGPGGDAGAREYPEARAAAGDQVGEEQQEDGVVAGGQPAGEARGGQRRYRDMPRRVRHISHLMVTGWFTARTLVSYATRNLQRMRRCLRVSSAQDLGVPARHMREIRVQITRTIDSRVRRPRQKEGRESLLVSKFVAHVLDRVRVERALRDVQAVGTLAAALRRDFKCPMVAWFYPSTLGQRWFNYRQYHYAHTEVVSRCCVWTMPV